MVNVLDLEGKKNGDVQLPPQFGEALRPDLVRRAVHSEFSFTLQPKGNFPLAGMQSSADYFGRRHESRQTINTGRSRLPREKLSGGRLGRVRLIPQSVKGRRAHPPKPWKKLIERMNIKEKNKAIRSAIAATADAAVVKARGHVFTGALPLVVSTQFEAVKKVKDAKKALAALGLEGDLNRAAEGRRLRSGRARLRRGGYRTPRSVLIVYGKDGGVWRATRKIPGVDCVDVSKLSATLLAPGGVEGRLTVWTEDAVERLGKENLFE